MIAAVPRRLRRARVWTGLVALAMTSILAAACATKASGGLSPATSLQSSYQATIRKALPSVVEISAGSTIGSGVVFNHRGDVVTNAHVIGKHTRFQVRSAVVSQTMTARLVGIFRPDDLAVIKVGRGSGMLRPAQWADSDQARPGLIVLAMGSPFGLADSVTQGIVSATGRTVTGPDIGGRRPAVIVNALQTSAAINRGNSGGALVLLTGQVLGIPTLTATDPEIGGRAAGIGFAIPANTVVSIARQLITGGRVTTSGRASLDITGETHVNSEHIPDGVSVAAATAGGAAAAAGIRTGDVIAGVAGRPTPDLATLDTLIAGLRPGERVKVEVLRGGSPRQVTVRLGMLVSPPPGPRKASHGHRKGRRTPDPGHGSPHPSRG